jgi:NAD(P)-dependent dehydrogenase (short-subunit alcohol dehydrogenase family)
LAFLITVFVLFNHLFIFHHYSTNYIPSASYAQSKLAQVIFTKSLDSRLRNRNIPVQVHAVHPGIVNTDLFDGTLLKKVAPWVPPLLFKVTFSAISMTPVWQ